MSTGELLQCAGRNPTAQAAALQSAAASQLSLGYDPEAIASKQEGRMKLTISLSALLIAGVMFASSEPASAVVYCQYISYPAGCIARPGVRLVARPVARAVTPGRPMNRGGPVNRVGRR